MFSQRTLCTFVLIKFLLMLTTVKAAKGERHCLHIIVQEKSKTAKLILITKQENKQDSGKWKIASSCLECGSSLTATVLGANAQTLNLRDLLTNLICNLSLFVLINKNTRKLNRPVKAECRNVYDDYSENCGKTVATTSMEMSITSGNSMM